MLSCVRLPMDCSLPGSSVHGIFQARVLEWVAISFSRGIFPTQGPNRSLQLTWSLPLIWSLPLTWVSRTVGRRFSALPSEPPGSFQLQLQALTKCPTSLSSSQLQNGSRFRVFLEPLHTFHSLHLRSALSHPSSLALLPGLSPMPPFPGSPS